MGLREKRMRVRTLFPWKVLEECWEIPTSQPSFFSGLHSSPAFLFVYCVLISSHSHSQLAILKLITCFQGLCLLNQILFVFQTVHTKFKRYKRVECQGNSSCPCPSAMWFLSWEMIHTINFLGIIPEIVCLYISKYDTLVFHVYLFCCPNGNTLGRI